MRPVQLPNSETALLMERADLSGGRRRVLIEALDANDSTTSTGQYGIGVACIRVLVSRWTVTEPGGTEPLPTPWDDPTALDRMNLDAQDALLTTCSKMMDEIMPREADPKSPAASATTSATD